MRISVFSIVVAAVVGSVKTHITAIFSRTGQTTPVAYQWTLPDGQKQLFFRPRDVYLDRGHPMVTVRQYPCVHTTAAGSYKLQYYAMCIPQVQVMTRHIYERHLRDQIHRSLIPGPGYGMGFDNHGPHGSYGMSYGDFGAFGVFPAGSQNSYQDVLFLRKMRRRMIVRRRLLGRAIRGFEAAGRHDDHLNNHYRAIGDMEG